MLGGPCSSYVALGLIARVRNVRNVRSTCAVHLATIGLIGKKEIPLKMKSQVVAEMASPSAAPEVTTTASPPELNIDPLLRLNRTLEIVGVSRATWYNAVKAGDAPAPYRVFGASVAWKLSELRAFVASRERVVRGGVGQ